jgi:hypothetical protein
MPLLYFGIGAFAALVGFLAATNSLTSIQGGLIAAIGAVVALAGLAEKFYIERSTEATHAQILSAVPGADAAAVASATVQIRQDSANRKQGLAKGVGSLLLSISAGFIVGFGVGYAVNDHLPSHIAAPWYPNNAPQSSEVAVGWIAIGEKLQKDGYSKQQIRNIYGELKDRPDVNSILVDVGKAWAKK